MQHHALERMARNLVQSTHPEMIVAVTTLEGADVIVFPKSESENMRQAAAITGAFFRAQTTEPPPERLQLIGANGSLWAHRIRSYLLLVSIPGDSLGTRFEAQLDDAVEETRSVLRT